MTAVRGVLTAVAVLWLLWFAHALTSDGPLSNSVRAYARAHWLKQAEQRAADRELRDHNRKANAAANDPLPDDYSAPPDNGN